MTLPETNVPTNIDFATEVKTDRLAMLWKITLGISVSILIIAVTIITVTEDASLTIWINAPLVLALSSLLTRWVIKKYPLEIAASIYVGGLMLSVAAALMETNPTAMQLVPYIYVVIIFIAGLLLRPQTTAIFAVLAAALTIAIPFAVTSSWDFLGGHQLFAIILMFFSMILAAQVTGELYAVTEWALMNYQRERRTNLDLFEHRMALQKSLQRSEALSDQLKDANSELADAHKAAEAAKNFRGQFLANMSHELRTPLNAIIGFSETMLKFPMMYDDTQLPDSYKNDLNQIYTSGRQLLHLINDILDLAKVDAGKLEVYMQLVDLKPVLEVAQMTASGLIGAKPIKLITKIPDPLPQVWADESRVRQVLINLYSNAVKFTDDGAITLTIEEKEGEIVFAVADTGCGIPESQLELIFEEFKQGQTIGRDPRAGSGLGLAISRQLLDLMNGRIWVESTVNKGSTFYFTLQPYHKEKIDTVERVQVSSAPEEATKPSRADMIESDERVLTSPLGESTIQEPVKVETGQTAEGQEVG